MKIKSAIKMGMLPIMAIFLPITASQAAGVSAINVNNGVLIPWSSNLALNATGQFIVFQSEYDLNGKYQGGQNLYLHDTVKKQTILADRKLSLLGAPNNYNPIMTPDGRFVAFDGLGEKNTDGKYGWDIFVRDNSARKTQLITVNTLGKNSGARFDASYGNFQITPNSRFVAFESRQGDLVAKDTNQINDVFVRDRISKTTTLVSVNLSKVDSGNEKSTFRQISDDGRFVLFESDADDLVANDINGKTDCFFRDLKLKRTKLLYDCSRAVVKNQYVVITTDKRLLVSDKNNVEDVYLYDLSTNKVKLVSFGQANKNFNPVLKYGASRLVGYSTDLRYVLFNKRVGSPQEAEQIGWENVFLRDLKTNKVRLISGNKSGKEIGGEGIALSSNGKTILYSSKMVLPGSVDTNKEEDYFLLDLATNKTTLLSKSRVGVATGVESFRKIPGVFSSGKHKVPAITANGNFVVFASNIGNLVSRDNNGKSDVFVRNVKTGDTQLVSSNAAGSNSGNDSSIDPVLSSDGHVVVFKSEANDLIAKDSDKGEDWFMYKLP